MIQKTRYVKALRPMADGSIKPGNIGVLTEEGYIDSDLYYFIDMPSGYHHGPSYAGHWEVIENINPDDIPLGVTPPFVVCGFPGIGKTRLVELMNKDGGYPAFLKWRDSDSSGYSWIACSNPKARNPDFPNNYIQHIRQQYQSVVLASSHKVVRDALVEADMKFSVCYPDRNCKEEYLERYRLRGSPEAFIKLLDGNWDTWIDEMEQEDRATQHIVLQPGEYASAVAERFWNHRAK